MSYADVIQSVGLLVAVVVGAIAWRQLVATKAEATLARQAAQQGLSVVQATRNQLADSQLLVALAVLIDLDEHLSDAASAGQTQRSIQLVVRWRRHAIELLGIAGDDRYPEFQSTRERAQSLLPVCVLVKTRLQRKPDEATDDLRGLLKDIGELNVDLVKWQQQLKLDARAISTEQAVTSNV